MSKVRGENVVVLIFSDGVWKPYVCARSASITVTTDFLEVSVSGHGKNATFAPTKNSFTGTMEGVVSLNEPGSLTLPELRQKQLSQETFLCRYQRTDSLGNVYTDEVRFFITNSSDTGSYDGVNTFSIELKGTGVITQIFVPTPTLNTNKVKRYEYTGIGGETGFTDAILIGKDILEVNKDGLGNSGIILAGTPVNKEVKYTTTTGGFEWGVTFEVGEKAYVLYQDI